MHGLGIGMTSDEDEGMTQILSDSDSTCNHYKEREEQIAPLAGGKPSQPSLYDAIFGPAFGRVALPGAMQNKSAHSSSEQRRSPHVRQGSSAFLEQVALSPSLGSPGTLNDHHFPSPKTHGQSHTHNTPSMSFGSPRRRWSSDVNMAFSTPSGDRSVHPDRRVSQQASPPSSHTFRATRGHKRMRSLGGSLLPNGHPASSLAQDLGLASGGGRLPRSRNASAIGSLTEQAGDVKAHLSGHEGREQCEDQETMAGFLLAGLASSEQQSRAGQLTPGRSPSTFVDPNIVTPRRRQRTSAVDSDTRHSARQQALTSSRRSHLASIAHEEEEADTNEAAAHSLLDLAASPSPLREASRARFPGHTPSLRGDLMSLRRFSAAAPSSTDATPSRSIQYRLMDDIDRLEADSRPNRPAATLRTPDRRGASVRGHVRTGSLGSHGVNDAGSPLRASHLKVQQLSASLHPSTPPSASRKHARTPSQIGRVRLMSPPITPPRSDETRRSGKTEQGDLTGLRRSSSPDTPSRLPRARGGGHQEEDGGAKRLKVPSCATDDENDEGLPTTPVKEEYKELIPLHDPGDLPAETPRTPPPMATTPRTPKAPGSNFSYGDFLHVSPSPKPRMRTNSHADVLLGTPLSSTLPSAAVALGDNAGETPTRATRSQARFLDFGSHTPTTALAAGDDPTSTKGSLIDAFTVGPVSQRRASGPNKGLGLGGAFEPMESTPVDDDDSHVLVPGKRAALVLQPSPPGGPKRLRRPSMTEIA